MKTGLFFGSFNPIHIGHMAIANYMAEYTDIDQLWFVVSPHNPLKKKSTLLPGFVRYELVELAIGKDPRFRASDIEFRLPKPSYTIDTLAYLKERHPTIEFALIMGADNLASFHKWKNYQYVEENYQRYIYPRPGYTLSTGALNDKTILTDAPLMEISSSFVRQAIVEKRDIRYFLPEKVYDQIDKMNYYRV